GPYAFHRVTVHTCTLRVTTSVLAHTMVDRPMVIVGRGEMVDVVFISEELRPAFHLSDDERFDRRGAHMLQYFQIDLRRWRVLIWLVAALHQAQQGGTAPRTLPRSPPGCGGRSWCTALVRQPSNRHT